MRYAASRYSEAAKPKPWQILGVKLKPLSIDHCITMQDYAVAFVSDDEREADLGDLILGVLICSKHWEEGEFDVYINSKKAEREIAAWSRKIGRDDAKDTARLFNVAEKIALFNEYVKDASGEPEHWIVESPGSKPSGAHWSQCVLLTLTAHLGYTRKEALHCPLKRALSDYFRHAETQGGVRLMSEEEIEDLKTPKQRIVHD